MKDPKMEQFSHILGEAYCEGNLNELRGDSNPMYKPLPKQMRLRDWTRLAQTCLVTRGGG